MRIGLPASLRPSRGDLVWAGVLLVTGVALCFVPLFDLLAYEFAFAIGVPLTFAAGGVGKRAAAGAGADLNGPVSALATWARAVPRGSPLLLVPLVPISLNALRVRNCDYLEGLAFYLVFPGVTLLVATAWGVVTRRLSRRFGGSLFVLGVLSTVAVGVWRFWSEPPVDVFNAFLGYYPGAIYDEVIPIDGRLLVARGEDLAWAFAAIAALDAVRALRRRAGLGRRLALVVAAIAAVVGLRAEAARRFVHRDAASIQAALGGRRDTPHFNIYFPAAWDDEEVARLVIDLEFDYVELTEFFGRAPSAPVQVYFYPSTATKKRLMGAGRTRIAKPWQRALHVQSPGVGDSVTRHELAHVFSAEVANSPHHLSLTPSWVPNMGLIEGVAVAATWDSGRLDPHQWSAAMRRIGVAPPLEQLMAPRGFLQQNASLAYTMCGSFVRYYRDQVGSDMLAETYRRGAVDPAWFPRWAAFVDRERLSAASLAVARARFDRPSIFGKTCAHELASLRQEAGEASAEGKIDAALWLVGRILYYVPKDGAGRLMQIDLLWRRGERTLARAAAGRLAHDDDAGVVLRARAREWLADMDALEGHARSAVAAYTELLAQAFDRSQERRLAVKKDATERGGMGWRVLELLTGQHTTEPDDPAAYTLDRLYADAPDWSVSRYLLGRSLAGNGAYERAAELLRQADEAGLPHPSLTLEALRVIAAARFRQNRYVEAAAAFDALAARDDLELERGERYALRTWARRARFFAKTWRAGAGDP